MRNLPTIRRRAFLRHLIGALVLYGGAKIPAQAKKPIRRPVEGRLPCLDEAKAVERLAFGSCCEQDKPQPIWDRILALKPDLFVFLGDNIYADTEDMKVTKAKYEMLGAKPNFASFRSEIPIIATWDDHDYGVNDGGAEYAMKEESKKLMLDFFKEPADSARRKRPGVYTSYLAGPAGKRLQVILLDLRWFRSPPCYYESRYLPNSAPDATILGAEQWRWLEQQLEIPADLRVIASSIQFASPDHEHEKWANFPNEKRKMIELLDRLPVKNAIFISGDIHHAELSVETTQKGTTLYDLTSSGLNLSIKADWPNSNRISVFDSGPQFGFIEIDWAKRPVPVSLQVRDLNGDVVIRKDIAF